MSSSERIKALIRNLSREKKVHVEILLRNYMLERFLERVSLSKYRDQFILKGGMLIASMVGIDTRSTMDMDATIKGVPISIGELKKVIHEIIEEAPNDGIFMTLKGIDEIRDDDDYPGYRVSIEAVLEKTKQTMKIDITTGDVITPKEINYSFKLLLENRQIRILAYNIETVLAEKLETILVRGTANTRMRDFYDVYIITTLRKSDIRWGVLATAFRKTAQHRETYARIVESGHEYLEDIENSDVLERLWGRYRDKNPYVEDLEWVDVKKSLRNLFERVMK
ncbi:MAG: nucleotidyl transferase AbiEii/AbiGii toxin family protein [Spirochaetales bacterium]|jgi:predicted nucleotidyltransferase component of viral defense system|nr:nucleotidyl transferase AbiEii/AbiGii toxin family protein [Spirochaetales bacterium]